MKHAAAIFATGLICLGTLLMSASTAAADIELYIDGERVLLEGAQLVEQDGRIVIRAESTQVRAGERCDIKLTGAEQLSLASLTGSHVAIFMDGNSRLNIDHLAAESLEATTGGYARLEVQESE